MAVIKAGQPIRTLEEWYRLSGPKADYQWVEERSAMEVARVWLHAATKNQMPVEVTTVLAGHPDFGSVADWMAEPEARLRFDHRRGEPRNTDLLVVASDTRGSFTMAVEAKADEPFGETVATAWRAAEARRINNPRSGGLDRLRDLCRALFGVEFEQHYALGELRYQLLTATAGLVAEASRRGTSRAILLVEEFRTAKTVNAKLAENSRDLNAFVRRLTGKSSVEVTAGNIIGPITLRKDALWKVLPAALYIGKIRHDLLSTGS